MTIKIECQLQIQENHVLERYVRIPTVLQQCVRGLSVAWSGTVWVEEEEKELRGVGNGTVRMAKSRSVGSVGRDGWQKGRRRPPAPPPETRKLLGEEQGREEGGKVEQKGLEGG